MKEPPRSRSISAAEQPRTHLEAVEKSYLAMVAPQRSRHGFLAEPPKNNQGAATQPLSNRSGAATDSPRSCPGAIIEPTRSRHGATVKSPGSTVPSVPYYTYTA